MPTFSSTADGYEMRTGQPADGINSVLIQTPISAGWNATTAQRFTEYAGVELGGTFTAGSVHGWPTAGVISTVRYYVLATPGDPASKQLLYEITGAAYDAAAFHAASEGIWNLFRLMTAGNDTLVGGAGEDDLYGGAGDDLYLANTWYDWTWEETNEGYDTVQASSSYTLRANVERLELTGTGDTDGAGNALDNVIIGNAGANNLSGDPGADTLDGEAGHDSLHGGLGEDLLRGGVGDDLLNGAGDDDRLLGATESDTLLAGGGNDRLWGGAGHDRLNGGLGDDRLTGGSGRDVFVFRGDSGRDVITDFGDGRDILSLDQAIFAHFGEVMAHARDTARGVQIEKDGVFIRLEGVLLSTLNADDFQFAAADGSAVRMDGWLT